MPEAYNWVSAVFPPRYFIVIIKSIMIKGTSFFYVWKETIILMFMTIVFIGLSVRNFKVRLQ
jgi:ABC-2 type transport system permease protein